MMIKRLYLPLSFLSISAIFIIILSTVADVVWRYLFNSPILGTIELNRTLLVFVVFFTIAYAQAGKKHMRVDLLLNRLPPRVKSAVNGLQLLLALVFIGIVTYGSSLVAIESTAKGEYERGIISFPMWPGRIAVALGCLALALQYVADIFETLRSARRRK